MDFKRAGSGTLFVVMCLLLGFLVGGVLGGRVFGGGGMGWDQLADTLGGMMVGVVVGLIASLYLVRRMTNRQLLIGALAAFGGVVLMAVILRFLPKPTIDTASGPPPTPVERFQPAFEVRLTTSRADQAMRAAEAVVPYSEVRVISDNKSMATKTWGRGIEMCVGLAEEDHLRTLVASLEALDGATGLCAPCTDCVPMTLSWNLDGAWQERAVTDQCLTSQAALRPVLETLNTIYRALGPSRYCEPLAEPNPYDPAQRPIIQVQEGAVPVIRWTPPGANELLVVRATALARDTAPRPMWHLVARPGEHFNGPVTYGEVPSGAREAQRALPLEAGEAYTVRLQRPDPQESGQGFQGGVRNEYADTLAFTMPR